MTVAEVRFGARNANWGSQRVARLNQLLAQAEVVWAGAELLAAYVDLQVNCVRVGHALGQSNHHADRWIAATAIHLGIPLVSHDGVFSGASDLVLETRRS